MYMGQNDNKNLTRNLKLRIYIKYIVVTIFVFRIKLRFRNTHNSVLPVSNSTIQYITKHLSYTDTQINQTWTITVIAQEPLQHERMEYDVMGSIPSRLHLKNDIKIFVVLFRIVFFYLHMYVRFLLDIMLLLYLSNELQHINIIPKAISF